MVQDVSTSLENLLLPWLQNIQTSSCLSIACLECWQGVQSYKLVKKAWVQTFDGLQCPVKSGAVMHCYALMLCTAMHCYGLLYTVMHCYAFQCRTVNWSAERAD